MNNKLKKTLIKHLPYLFIALFATKLGQMWRLTSGNELGEKILNLGEGFFTALQSPLPSFHPFDLCAGAAAAVIIRLIVYGKSKNTKKYRKNEEYGSARWGKSEDIAPYIDPEFKNNVILTQTESPTMNSRPKDSKTARNKNVLIIGGFRFRKTRFWLKQNLMQMHSSDVGHGPERIIMLRTEHTRTKHKNSTGL